MRQPKSPAFLLISASLLVAFAFVVGCSDEDFNGAEESEESEESGDSNGSESDPECAQLEEEPECREQPECYFIPASGTCEVLAEGPRPNCDEKSEPCDGSEDLDFCESEGNCCALELGERDVEETGDGEYTCADESSMVSLCVPENVRIGDSTVPDILIYTDEDEGVRKFRSPTLTSNFEEIGFYRCSGMTDEEFREICRACY